MVNLNNYRFLKSIMKASKYPLFTQKNEPSDAEIISHNLMIKAGLVRQQSSGQYSFLPIGLRILKKIENFNYIEEVDMLNLILYMIGVHFSD